MAVRSVIRETCAVATAKGVLMDADEFIAHDHQDIVTNIADYYPSMCQDMLFNHRQTEIDVPNGKIAEYGEQLGIDTPVCKFCPQVGAASRATTTSSTGSKFTRAAGRAPTGRQFAGRQPHENRNDWLRRWQRVRRLSAEGRRRALARR